MHAARHLVRHVTPLRRPKHGSESDKLLMPALSRHARYLRWLPGPSKANSCEFYFGEQTGGRATEMRLSFTSPPFYVQTSKLTPAACRLHRHGWGRGKSALVFMYIYIYAYCMFTGIHTRGSATYTYIFIYIYICMYINSYPSA